MKSYKLTIVLIVVISICFLTYNNLNNLQKVYIKVFNKSILIANHNSNGQVDGQMLKYADGKLQIEENYKNGLKDGWSIKYYDDGHIENRKFYKNNKAQGTEYGYYKNGSLRYSRTWRDNKLYGSLFYNYENGKINAYGTYDIMGWNFFDYHYKQSGEIAKKEGFVVSSNIYSLDEKSDTTLVLNYDAYHHDNRFHNIKDLYLTVATPPNTKLQVNVDINNQSFKDLTIVDNTIRIPNAFPTIDTYHIFVTTHLFDKKNKVIDGINIKTVIIKE